MYLKLFGVLKKKKKTHIPCTVCNKTLKLRERKSKQFVLFAKNGLLVKEDYKSDPLMVTINHLIIQPNS